MHSSSSAALVLVGLLIAGAAHATESESATSASEARALSLLKKSADYLSQAKAFRVRAELSFDVVQEDGEKIEFGATRMMTVRRPDHAYVEGRRRDGERANLYIDAQTVTLLDLDENVFATAKVPGNLDATMDYLVDQIGVPAPLSDLVYSNLYSVLREQIESGTYIGESTLAGVRCHHLAFRRTDLDWQIWVEDGERPLMRRIVITYKTSEEGPQFRARLFDWDLAPEVLDSLFAFTPPAGAQQVPFVARTKLEEGRR